MLGVRKRVIAALPALIVDRSIDEYLQMPLSRAQVTCADTSKVRRQVSNHCAEEAFLNKQSIQRACTCSHNRCEERSNIVLARAAGGLVYNEKDSMIGLSRSQVFCP